MCFMDYGSEGGGLSMRRPFGSRMVCKHKATSVEVGFASWYTKLVAGVCFGFRAGDRAIPFARGGLWRRSTIAAGVQHHLLA